MKYPSRSAVSLQRLLPVTVWLIVCLLLPLLTARAQTPAPRGEIAGRVVDATTQAPLAGAHVTLTATGDQTATDALGAFGFRAAPVGPQSVAVSYLGFPETTQSVTVVAAQTATALIALGRAPAGAGETLQLDAFVVEGMREGQARALNQQRASDNLKTIVAADAIGEFPDTNAAEAAMRLPGINVARDQGEGKFIGIRGFNTQLNNVTLNGVQAPSSRNSGREIALDLVPVDNIASIEITKSVTPDQDATALGGTVNIITKNAFARGGPSFDASLRLGYNDLPQKWLYSGSVGFGDVYRGGDFGAFVSASYFNSDRGSHSVQGTFAPAAGPAVPPTVPPTPAPLVMTQANLVDNAVRRTRYGLTTDFDYRLSADATAYFRLGYTRHDDRQVTDTLQTNFAGTLQPGFTPSSATFTGGALTRVIQFFVQQTGTFSVTGGGQTRRGNLTVDGSANFGYAFGVTTPDSFNLLFRATGVTSSYELRDTYYPTFTSNVDRNDLTRFAFAGGVKTDQQNYQYDYNGMLNVKFDRVFGATPGYLKFGGKLHRTDKEFDIENLNLTTYTGPGAPLLASAFGRPGTPGFLDHRYDFGPRLDHAAAQKFLNDNLASFGVNVPASVSSNSGDYVARETVNALYAMASLDPLPKLRVVAGVRGEFTDTTVTGTQAQTGPGNIFLGLTRLTQERSYDNFLPGVNLRYELVKHLTLRAAWTNTLARPQYPALSPGGSINFQTNTLSMGNPDLQPYTAQNFDADIAYYLPKLGLLSASLFRKDISDPIFNRTSTVTDGPYAGFTVLRPENAAAARLNGLELAWQQSLTFLPRPFDRLGLSLNQTWLASDVVIPTRPGEKFTFFGQSPRIANASVFYQDKRWQARVAYSWQDSYLNSVGSRADLDRYIDARGQIDASVQFKLSQNFRLFLEGQNLSNTPFLSSYGNGARLNGNDRYGWTITGGVKLHY